MFNEMSGRANGNLCHRFSESDATFEDWVAASNGIRRAFTGEEMLRIHYAFLRGAARQFDRAWGPSIYEVNISLLSGAVS